MLKTPTRSSLWFFKPVDWGWIWIHPVDQKMALEDHLNKLVHGNSSRYMEDFLANHV
jgi:hypothetical protein